MSRRKGSFASGHLGSEFRRDSPVWNLFHALPAEVQELAVKNYRLWQRDPQHPSLHFRRLKGSADRFSVRIGDHYRALGSLAADTITWVWIGTHAEYDRLVGS